MQVVRVGAGPRVILIHGTAVDHATWANQLASAALQERVTLIAYDRRADAATVEDQADDAVALLADSSAPALIVGSSFGAVIALDVVRRYPRRCAGAILIEPGLEPGEEAPADAAAALAAYDRRIEEAGGPAAAELFLETALGAEALRRMAPSSRERAGARWREIRADIAASLAYRPRYRELAAVHVPVLLVGGGRTGDQYDSTMERLRAALPAARRAIIDNAGHMVHAEAPRRFAELLTAFAAEVFPAT